MYPHYLSFFHPIWPITIVTAVPRRYTAVLFFRRVFPAAYLLLELSFPFLFRHDNGTGRLSPLFAFIQVANVLHHMLLITPEGALLADNFALFVLTKATHSMFYLADILALRHI